MRLRFSYLIVGVETGIHASFYGKQTTASGGLPAVRRVYGLFSRRVNLAAVCKASLSGVRLV